MDAALNEAKPTYASSTQTVEEIERLKPQATLPARIAVAPPVVIRGMGLGAQADTWHPDEVAVIESWLEPLRSAGIATDLIVLPSALLQECPPQERGCRLRAQRAAAARLHADALLVL